MKYELLKRTAIALFVGGIVSTYAMAEDKSVEDALTELGKAIKADATKQTEAVKSELTKKIEEQDKKINDDLSGVASDLVGVAANSYNNTLTLNGFKAGDDVYDVDTTTGAVSKKTATEEDVNNDPLGGKGIVATVVKNKDSIEDLSEDLVKTDKNVEKLAGDVTKNREDLIEAAGAVKDLQDGVSDLHEVVYGAEGKPEEGLVDIVTKHTDAIYGTDNNPGLMEVVRKQTEAINDLKAYNSLDDVKALVANKADKTDVDANKAEIAKKANQTDVTAALSAKADKTALETKADQDYVEGLERDVKANTSDIKDLSVGIRDHVLPAIEANRTDIDANKADVDTLKNKVAGAAAAVDLLTQNIALNKTNIESKADQDYVEGLERDVKANTSDIKDLSVGIRDHVLPAIEANRSDIDKNASHITDIRNKQALQNARLDNHGERIEANKAAIGDLARATNEAVTNLGNAVSGLDEDLAGTQDAVAENRKDIDKNASRITDTRNKQVLQNARLDNHGERIDANKAAIATNVDKIATNKAAIATNADKIATNVDKIATNVDKIATNKAAIATNADKIATKADKNSVYSKSETDEKFALKADNSVVRAQATDISNLRTDVNAHKVDIDKLRTDVNVHTKRLDHLDNRVNKLDKDLKRGLAAQAALTGLFQPYTVGKANFTAAVGGYKSQTAVAVGTGYRYNQNIATKAGVAFTQGGGVTYNAGVNFEW